MTAGNEPFFGLTQRFAADWVKYILAILGAYERYGASEHGEAKSFKNTNPGLPSKVAIFRHPLKNGVINALQPL